MKIYMAGLYASNLDIHGAMFARMNEREKKARLDVRDILESYHYVGKQSAVDKIHRDGTKLFLDSGAFSAFTLGKVIDLDGYCRYIHENQDIIEMPSVLDAVGDAEQTWRNQCAMQARGTQPLPCFHYGEPEEYLVRYVANYPYISLGGMVPISRPQLHLWLDRIWQKYLTHPDGTPKIKVHGFGITTTSLIEDYPWYSVDSTQWVQLASYGGIILPNIRDGFRGLYISTESPSRQELYRHYETISPMEREAVDAFITGRGFEVERLRKNYLSRWAFNLDAYNGIIDRLKDNVRLKPRQINLF